MKKLPKILILVLYLLNKNKNYENVIGDFEEYYNEKLKESGYFSAYFWCLRQTIISIPKFFKTTTYWSFEMFKNYLKIAIRNINRNKITSFLNIFGLSIGISACVIIMLYLQDEVSFDLFHKDPDNIYRVINQVNFEGRDLQYHAVTPGVMAAALIDTYPEVVNSSKVWKMDRYLISNDNKKIYVNDPMAADNEFFNIFSFEMINGSELSALKDPNSMVLTRSTALKLFNSEEVVGRSVIGWNNKQYKITGLMEDPPENSHIQFEVIISWPENGFLNRWLSHTVNTYVSLKENTDPKMLETMFPELLTLNLPSRKDNYTYKLQPLKDIHLYSSNIMYDFNWRKGNISYFYIFSLIALFILGIACINFMNLATAGASKRTKEIAMRKVIGARRTQLVNQFLGESLAISVLALLLSFALVKLLLPVFNSVIEKSLVLNINNNLTILSLSVLLTFFVGILAGTYPALYLSAFNPLRAMKGLSDKPKSRNIVRYTLSTLQFTASITLIIGTAIVFNQVKFMKNKNLGYDKEQVLVIPINDRSVVPGYKNFREELLSFTDIVAVGASTHVMGMGLSTYGITPEGVPPDQKWIAPVVSVDHDFIPTMGIEIIKGRNFSKEFQNDILGAVIVNEKFVQEVGWDDPIGKLVGHGEIGNKKAQIIGVVKDFNMRSLHEDVGPIVLYMDSERLDYLTVRIRPDNITETIRSIENNWSNFNPVHPFEYSFLDQDLNQSYNNDQKIGNVFGYLSVLAIFISCLGLFGLATFSAEQRTKEIGIRKVFGASPSKIAAMLSNDFLKFIIISNFLAWPIAYYFMEKWIQTYAYRINIGLDVFILAAVITLTISILTIGFQVAKSAISNPVDALRYE